MVDRHEIGSATDQGQAEEEADAHSDDSNGEVNLLPAMRGNPILMLVFDGHVQHDLRGSLVKRLVRLDVLFRRKR